MIDIFKLSIYQSDIKNLSEMKKLASNYSPINRNKLFFDKFENCFKDNLNEICKSFEISHYKIIDIWTISYKKNDYHKVHNHRTIGLTGIIYLEYDEFEHEPIYFIVPYNDPVKDTSLTYKPKNIKEGSFIVFPSFLNHFSNPNLSNKERKILAFDLVSKSNASFSLFD